MHGVRCQLLAEVRRNVHDVRDLCQQLQQLLHGVGIIPVCMYGFTKNQKREGEIILVLVQIFQGLSLFVCMWVYVGGMHIDS